MTTVELQDLKGRCRKFLHGHPPQTPKQIFSDLSAFVSGDEWGDIYGNGESLQGFERELADLFGMDQCVFLPSGTMAQLIALRIWSEEKQNELVSFHPTSHLELHEQDSYRALHGLRRQLLGDSDRVIQLQDLRDMKEVPSAVLLELPQREIGGQLPEWDDLCEQVEFLKDQGIRIHLDGARIWECAAYYNKTYREMGTLFDSVYVSFYKGIGGISGAALLGPQDFIESAKIWARRHGGNTISQFPTYLSAKLNLKKRRNRFQGYFAKTQELADHFSQIAGVEVFPQKPQVNMFHLFLTGNDRQMTDRLFEYARKKGVWTWGNLRKGPKPGTSRVELYVGDGAMELETLQAVEALRYIVHGPS